MGLQECSHLPAAFLNLVFVMKKTGGCQSGAAGILKNPYKREDAGWSIAQPPACIMKKFIQVIF